jgi:hypothetical protein
MITYFPPGEWARGQRRNASLSSVLERFRTPIVTKGPKGKPDKATLPGWSPTIFRGDYRSLEHVEYSCAVGLDCEKGETRFESTCTLWSEFHAFVHTTYSHAPDEHRLRVIFPTSRPITLSEYYRVHRWLARGANEAGQCVDMATRDPSRFWYVAGIAPGDEYLSRELTGATLNVESVLRCVPDEPKSGPIAPVIPLRATTSTIERARRYLDKCDIAIEGSHGHTTTFLVAQKLVRGFLLDENTAYSLLTEWNRRCKPPWSEKDLRRKVKEAAEAGRFERGALLNARRA